MNGRFSRMIPACVGIAVTAPLISAALGQRAEDKPLPPAPAVAVEHRFDFGGVAAEGYTPVPRDAAYSPERGYGFDLGSPTLIVEHSAGDALHDGYATASAAPFFFSVGVPEGNYRVTVTLAGAVGSSSVTLRGEAAHLLLTGLPVPAGNYVTRTVYVNVRRPELPPPPPNAPGASRVHMFLPGEKEARAWDEKLTLEFNGTNPAVAALEIVKDDRVPTLFVAGDSTVGDPRRGPGGNWPTQLCQFFKPEIVVCNSAEGGETSKSFITGARFDKVLSQLKPGDFFLIQFGHNDSKPQWPQSYTEPETTFKAYLGVYLAETRRRGARLVLATPMERRANGDTVGRWARAMREFGAEYGVPVIDQWTASKQLWSAMGDRVGEAFVDPTHLSGYGGYLLARLMVGGIRRNVPELARFLAEEVPAMDPSQPEPPPAYLGEAPGPTGHLGVSP